MFFLRLSHRLRAGSGLRPAVGQNPPVSNRENRQNILKIGSGSSQNRESGKRYFLFNRAFRPMRPFFLFSPLGLFGLNAKHSRIPLKKSSDSEIKSMSKPENNRFFLLLPPASFWASWMHLFENFRFGLASFKTSPVWLSHGRTYSTPFLMAKSAFVACVFV